MRTVIDQDTKARDVAATPAQSLPSPAFAHTEVRDLGADGRRMLQGAKPSQAKPSCYAILWDGASAAQRPGTSMLSQDCGRIVKVQEVMLVCLPSRCADEGQAFQAIPSMHHSNPSTAAAPCWWSKSPTLSDGSRRRVLGQTEAVPMYALLVHHEAWALMLCVHKDLLCISNQRGGGGRQVKADGR